MAHHSLSLVVLSLLALIGLLQYYGTFVGADAKQNELAANSAIMSDPEFAVGHMHGRMSMMILGRKKRGTTFLPFTKNKEVKTDPTHGPATGRSSSKSKNKRQTFTAVDDELDGREKRGIYETLKEVKTESKTAKSKSRQ